MTAIFGLLIYWGAIAAFWMGAGWLVGKVINFVYD
jgi:hypothetical protein